METPKPPFGNPPLSEWRKGCRIVDLWELAQQMNCEQCSSLLDLNRTTLETRAGLASVLYIVCQCGVTNKVHTSKKQTIAKTTTAYFINIQASISVQHYCRISAEQACKFLNELGIPATEEVFDTTDQVSKTLCPVETITQLEPVATCQETRSVFKIENKADFCKHPPVDTMDLLECASTDVLFSGKAPGAWADMGTDDLMQHINTKRLVDEKGSAEEFQEAWQAELHSVTSDNKEENVEDKAGTLDQSKDLPLTETAIKTEVQACMHNPLELEGTEECKVRCEVEDGGTEWNETNKKSGEAEFGESPSSCDTRAAVTGTTAHGSHEDNGSSILNSTSHSQQAKPPAASIFRFRARKSNTESFIVNDVCAPFKCSECGARFGLQKALSRHKNLHANERTIIHKFHNPEEIQNKGKDKSCKKFNACSQEKNDLSQNICDQFVKKVVSCQEGSSPSSKVSVMHRNESEDMLNGDSCDETKKVAEKQNDHCKDCNDGERFFKCSKCHAAFDTSSALEDHFKFHTDHRLFSWQDCSANIHKDKYLKCHGSRIHRNKRTFSCPDCSVTVTSASSLKNHMRTHTGEKPFKCEVCEKMYAEKSNLRTHMRTHSGNLPHVCPDCGKAFAFPSRLSMHRHTVHSGQRPYSCQECRAAFPTISNLNLHMRVHTDKRYFACEICKKTFRQSGHLNRHIEEHKSGKTFLCQDCGKTFPNKEYFDHHYRIHSGERPYKCPSCSATFSQSASRWLHYMRIHAGKTFVCEVCHRAFKSKQSLTLHQEIHSGKECLCQQCGKTFVGKLRLQAHLRNRCGSSSSIIKGCYTCKDCGMTFSYPSNLYRHKKGVHLRLKPHQCAICQKSFSQSNTLKAHLLTHPKSDV